MMIKIDKQQVVKENIEWAIRSLFESQLCASTTLIGAASSVLKDLLKDKSSRKTTSNLFPEIEEKKIYEELDKIWNFCKHAKKEDEVEAEISINSASDRIMLAIRDYRALYTDPTLLMQLYELWFCAKDLNFLNQLPNEWKEEVIKKFGKLYNEERSEQIRKGWSVIKIIMQN